MKILVTGGAGYIGSHTVAELLRQKFTVIVFDSLTSGHKESVKCPVIVGNLLNEAPRAYARGTFSAQLHSKSCSADYLKLSSSDSRPRFSAFADKEEINQALKKEKFDAVVHFAAFPAAGESMKYPAKFFENNLQGGLNLLEAMKNNNVNKIVFSSSSSVYGFPKKLPVKEDEAKRPISVYAETKLMFERILYWYNQLFGIKNVCLRYFNASGASLDASIGEAKEPATNIVPVLMKVALGQTEKFTLFGDDYATPDGTCIRDYTHVLDLASAHVKALEYLAKGGESDCFNIGAGKGYSNREVIDMVKKVTKVDFKVEIGPRRPGDPDAVYADNSKAKKILGWEPKYSDLETIIKTAWNWHKSHPEGFKGV